MKKSPTCFDKKSFSLSRVQTSGRFFQIIVAFSEKLDFTQSLVLVHLIPSWLVEIDCTTVHKPVYISSGKQTSGTKSLLS